MIRNPVLLCLHFRGQSAEKKVVPAEDFKGSHLSKPSAKVVTKKLRRLVHNTYSRDYVVWGMPDADGVQKRGWFKYTYGDVELFKSRVPRTAVLACNIRNNLNHFLQS